MKLLVRRETFAEALDFVRNVVKVRTPKPVLTAVRLIAKDRTLFLVATDLEMSVRWAMSDVDIEAPGEACIPAEKLAAIVGSLGDETLTLDSDAEHIMAVRGNWSNFKLFGYNPEDHPLIEEYRSQDDDLVVDGPTLARMIEQTEYSCAKEVTRFSLNAMLFEMGDGLLRLVSSDGHRLNYVNGKASCGKHAAPLPVPRRALMLLKDLLGEAETECRVQSKASNVAFAVQPSGGPAYVSLRTCMVDGTFPLYSDFIPKGFDHKAVVGRELLEQSVRQATLMTNEESKGIRLNFTADRLQISSRVPERGEARIDVAAELTGQPIEIGINPKYLLEWLSATHAEKVTIELVKPNKPIRFTGDPDAVGIIMPVGLN